MPVLTVNGKRHGGQGDEPFLRYERVYYFPYWRTLFRLGVIHIGTHRDSVQSLLSTPSRSVFDTSFRPHGPSIPCRTSWQLLTIPTSSLPLTHILG